MTEQPSYRRTLHYDLETDRTTCGACRVTVDGDWRFLTCPHGPSQRLGELVPDVGDLATV